MGRRQQVGQIHWYAYITILEFAQIQSPREYPCSQNATVPVVRQVVWNSAGLAAAAYRALLVLLHNFEWLDVHIYVHMLHLHFWMTSADDRGRQSSHSCRCKSYSLKISPSCHPFFCFHWWNIETYDASRKYVVAASSRSERFCTVMRVRLMRSS